ncbi:MAG: CTP synthetase [Pseudorhodobacter sp.]|jgi:preprotein translocase subunit SecF|nr:CTP synthetase [Pseudorhodobacter sp.]
MFRLFSVVYALTGPTLAGILMVVALTMGLDDLRSIVVAVAVGFVLGVPAAWLVAKQILSNA